MGTTGLIYVAIVAAWAAYLVPLWLRRHDEQSRLRTAERYSSAMRVLSRHDDGGKSRYVAHRRDESARTRSIGPEPKRSAAHARARRAATLRRRRVLSLLVLTVASVSALAALAMVPRWAIAVPAATLVLFLVLARISVRRARRARPVAPARSRRATRTDVAFAYGVRVDGESAPQADADQRGATDQPVTEPPAEGLWDPVPVTLPIYVYKEKAPRTVRTISLPGTEFAVPAPSAGDQPADTTPAAGAATAHVEAEPSPAAEPQEVDEYVQIARAVGD